MAWNLEMLSPDYTIEQVVSSLLYQTFCFIFLAGLHGPDYTIVYLACYMKLFVSYSLQGYTVQLDKHLYFIESCKHAGTA